MIGAPTEKLARAVAGVALLLGASLLRAQATPPAIPPVPSASVDTSYANYEEGPISLPLGIGLRIPSYNRVDGVVLPWGPIVSLSNDHIRIDPTITYRSHIGKVDPFVKIRIGSVDAVQLELDGGRGTFTNDDWIRSNVVNSLTALGVGSDSRNYFRADRGTASLFRGFAQGGFILTPSLGFLMENDWSMGSPVRHTNAPWSFYGRSDSLKMRRTNPAIFRGHVTSGIGELKTEYEGGGVKGFLSGRLERGRLTTLPFVTPVGGDVLGSEDPSGDFTQLTFNSKVTFLTFGSQHFDFRGHAVFTPGDVFLRQRFSYIGGAGTLATVDLLALGGDDVLYVEGEYSVPIERIVLPLIGNPIVSARYAAGSAGVGGLPDFIQNVGVGLGVQFLKAEYHIDPNYRKTPFSRKSAFSIGISLPL
jgi:hypothetical protein